MKFEDFTKEQQQAIVQKGSNIIVSAGAGSGKTAVLTQRVLNFIENEGLHLDEFLILTFTKLAAGEMKDRIRSALKERNLEDANLVDTSDITTFDAYALSIVKKYHNLLNVSPNVSIIDSNIITVKKRNIIKDIFEEYYTNDNEAFTNLISAFCFKDDEMIQDLVLKLHEASCLQMDSNEYLDTFIEKFYSDEMIQNHLEYYIKKMEDYKALLQDLLVCLPNVPLTKTSQDLLVDYLTEKLDQLFNSTCYDDLVTSLIDVKMPRQPGSLDDKEKEAFKEFKSLFEQAQDLFASLPQSEVDFYNYFKDLFPHIELLITITKRLEKELREYKDSRSVYEFQDIAKMALELFKNKPEICKEIRDKLKMIMIDEYQDTSLIQEKFIEQIANNNVYMVGDIKQSIYRFRNAVSDIFKNKYSAYSNNDGGVAIDLNKNFRSRKEVLDDINYIFKQIMHLDMGGADYRASHIIEYGNKSYITKGSCSQNNNSNFIFYDTECKNKVETEIEIIAKDIITKKNNGYLVFDKDDKKLRPCKFSDFCILLDRGSSFDEYVRIFNDHHIPLFVENDENISNNIVVKVLTSVLKLIKCISNNDYKSKEFIHAFLSIARSFIYNYSDQQLYDISKVNGYDKDKIVIDFKNIIVNNKDLPTYEVFLKIIFELNIYNSFINLGDVKKNESYLDTFIDVFRQMHELDYTIDDFITYLKHIDQYNLKINLPSSGNDTDSVKLMNIHKSKGLEFSIIYFAGLTKSYNREELNSTYGVSSIYGLYFPTFKGKENIIRTRNTEYESWEDSSEKIRLFYVALTRTKEKMIFVMPSNDYSCKKYLINRKRAKELYEKYKTFEEIFNLYITKQINYDTFVILVKMVNAKLPYSFIKAKDKLSYTFDKLVNELSLEESYINKAKDLINDIRNDVKDKECVNELIDEYKYLKYLIKWDLAYGIDVDIDSLVVDVMKNFTSPTIEELYYDWVNGVIDSEEFFKKGEKLIGGFSMKMYCIDDFTNVEWTDEFIKTSYDFVEIRKMLQEFFMNCINNNIDASIIRDVISSMGYSFNEKYYNEYKNTDLISEIGYRIVDVLVGISPESELNNETYDYIDAGIRLYDKYAYKGNDSLYDGILGKYFDMFKNKTIDMDRFLSIIQALGYETTVYFKTYGDYNELNLHDAVVKYGSDSLVVSSSFIELISGFNNYDRFNQEYAEIEVAYPGLKFDELDDRDSYDIRELNLDVKEVYTARASKNIDINASYNNLEFGNNIHYLLELLDFYNPDYSYIKDDFYRGIIERFVSSSLIKNITNGTVYKEFEYIDESSSTRGVIDLLVVYDDHIDIIDYKTKNIDDAGYDKQLKSYRLYIESKFKKRVKTYLYSLLTGEIREVL